MPKRIESSRGRSDRAKYKTTEQRNIGVVLIYTISYNGGKVSTLLEITISMLKPTMLRSSSLDCKALLSLGVNRGPNAEARGHVHHMTASHKGTNGA